jgi:hypothetical protein
MRRTGKPVSDCRTGARQWAILCPESHLWCVVAALWLAVPWWGWGQSNALNKAAQPAGALIRLSALHPEQLEELKGRPLCVYNFTSW